MKMSRRRFMIVLVTLVALNSFFWLAAGGAALTKSIIGQFFGNNMIRAEVLVQGPGGVTQDWRIDRGKITAIAGTTITLLEKDGTLVPVPVDPNARVLGPPRFASVSRLKPKLRVVLYHQANLPADLVQVEAG
jgi:hypothetical protein